MAVLDLTQSNFDETIANNEIVIIDFWAPWCGPCLQFAPTFKETSEKVDGVAFAKINTEDENNKKRRKKKVARGQKPQRRNMTPNLIFKS